MSSDDMTIIHHIGITIDDDIDPAPENVPAQQQQQQGQKQKVGEVWKSEGIISPWKANNVQNYFVFFGN